MLWALMQRIGYLRQAEKPTDFFKDIDALIARDAIKRLDLRMRLEPPKEKTKRRG